MNLCACGCGLPANPELGAFVDYSHGTRYERNGRRAVPYDPNERVDRPCRYCGKYISRTTAANAYHPECVPPDPDVPPLTGADIRLLARTLAARDPYPLETTSADIALHSPTTLDQAFDARQRERGLTRVECPECGSGAWQEPPCTVNGEVRTVIRCRSCAEARKANLRCASCGERPPRYKRDLCAPCWRERREQEMATKPVCPYCKEGFDPKRSGQITCGAEVCKKKHVAFLSSGPERKKLGPGAPPVGRHPAGEAPAGKADYTRPEVPDTTPAPPPPATIHELLEKGAREALAAGDYETPASDGIFGSEPEAYEIDLSSIQRDARNPNACPVLAAVLALEALPPEKTNAILDLVDARRQARLAEARAAGLLRELAASL